MSAEVHDESSCEVSRDEAKSELERLLADSRFHATERQRAILTHLAERHFLGCADSVKAYTIAVDVLGRSAGFDASLDPIVRIEVSRLRTAVGQYYEAFGSPNGVSIELPKGRYVTDFVRASVGISREPATELAIPNSPEEDVPSQQGALPGALPFSGIDWRPHAAIAAVLVATIVAGVSIYGTRPVYSTRPVVSIDISAADSRLKDEADQTRDVLLTALTQFRTLSLATGPERITHGARRAASTANRYEISMKYYGDGGDRSIWWQIIDVSSGDILKSGVERADTEGKTLSAVRDELVTALARHFAANGGVINNIEMHDSADGALGNACVLRAEFSLDVGGTGSVARSEGCLERTLADNPNDADAAATLSRMLGTPKVGDLDPADRVRAMDLANRAVAIAPMSDRAQIALMMARFYNGRTEAAIQAGNRALALNPNNPDVPAKLGMVLYLSGFKDAGVAMAQDAGRYVESVPRDAAVVLALEAYQKKNWSQASLLSEQVNCSNLLVQALRAASLGQLGSDQAKERLADFRSRNPQFEVTFAKDMAAQRLPQEIYASLEDGMKKAGASFAPSAVASAF
ncbi:tetratricopeptide repeat protein [Rhizobium sp. BK376]|uniref:tetratricopeptide repeat protein n=1 Tax=Rhizobium sp. BK376 TaxID=2512149 RepID=UPI0010451A73|nr:tetratricopeptide repeat protein [Rhizobium sp. BK376]